MSGGYGAAGAAAGGIVSGIVSAGMQYGMNKKLQKAAFRFSRSMRETAYQTTVEDLKKAGLNPVLALKGPTATPSATGASVGAAKLDPIGAMQAWENFKLTQQSTAKMGAEARSADAKAYEDELYRAWIQTPEGYAHWKGQQKTPTTARAVGGHIESGVEKGKGLWSDLKRMKGLAGDWWSAREAKKDLDLQMKIRRLGETYGRGKVGINK